MKTANSLAERDRIKGVLLWESLPGGRWKGYEAGDALPVAPVRAEARMVSVAAFVGRFTAAELDSIMDAAYVGAGNKDVRKWLFGVQTAGRIDLAAASTAAGLDMLVGKSLLTAPRKTAILT